MRRSRRRSCLRSTLSGSGHPVDRLSAITWSLRLPGAELAELVWDADLDAEPAPYRAGSDDVRPDAGSDDVRPDGGSDDVRLLCFAGPGISVAIEVGRRLPRAVRGRARSAAAGELWLQRVSGDGQSVQVDGDGCFALPAVPAGPIRLVFRRGPGEEPVVTSWVLID